MKMETFYSLKIMKTILTFVLLLLLLPVFSQRISELPPATFIGFGDLIPIVQNGVTKKLPYSDLTNSLHFLEDSLFVKYRCHKIKGASQWYFSGDTIFIDTCHISLPPGLGGSDSLFFSYGCYSGVSKWYYSGDTIFLDTCFATASADTCLFNVDGDTIFNKNRYKVKFTDSVYFDNYAIPRLQPGEKFMGFLTLRSFVGDVKQLAFSTVQDAADSIFIDPPDLLVIDSFIKTDSTAKGTASKQIAGEKLVFGELCYLKSDGKVYRADADSVIFLPGLFMVCDKNGASLNDTALFLTDGYIRCDARWSWATKGAVLYASGTLGGLSDSAPSGSHDGVQTVGIVQTADIVRFRPDLLIIELE